MEFRTLVEPRLSSVLVIIYYHYSFFAIYYRIKYQSFYKSKKICSLFVDVSHFFRILHDSYKDSYSKPFYKNTENFFFHKTLSLSHNVDNLNNICNVKPKHGPKRFGIYCIICICLTQFYESEGSSLL